MTKQQLYSQFLYLSKRMMNAISDKDLLIAKLAKRQMDSIYEVFMDNMWCVDELFFWLWKGARGIHMLEQEEQQRWEVL